MVKIRKKFGSEIQNNQVPIKPVAALYIRVSTDSQAEEGYSVEEQKKSLIAQCTIMGITDYRLYIDAGWSGSTMERPEMNRLIRDIKDKKITHVLCYKLDRISRSQKDMLYFMEDILVPNQIAFISLKETIDTGSPMGKLLVGVLSAFAQLEREFIRDRTQMGMVARVESGLWPGGDRTPLGYDYDKEQGILVPNKDADLIRNIFNLYLRGFSPQTIAEITGLKYGNWILEILRRKTYIGIIVYGGKEYKGKHKSIIDEEIFYRVQKRLDERSIARLNQSKSLLTGLMKCGHCGAAMHYQSWGKGKKKIGCYSRSKSKSYLIKDPNCPQTYYDPELIEGAILNEVFRFVMEIKINTMYSTSNYDMYELQKNLEALEVKIKRLYGLYAESSDELLLDTINEMKKRRDQMAEQIELLQKKSSETFEKKEIMKNVESLRDVWDILSIDDKRNILHMLIEKIYITDTRIEVNYRI